MKAILEFSNPVEKIIKYLITSLVLITVTQGVHSQDLPGPSANLQTLPTGSLIIPMDNTYQIGGTGLFNIKSYGLIVHLLNNDIKVKWVIKSGKAKDGIDFSATTELRMPLINATPTLRDFRGGPFVVFEEDTLGMTSLINSFYATNGLVGNSRPKVQRLLIPTVVDVRYDLTGFKPKAGILNDGANEAIHLNFMSNASVPAINYGVTSGVDLISGCYTFASEPHNGSTGAAVDAAISSIRDFVEWGGNFLAQCEAVRNYENNVNGRFQTSTGIAATNTAIGTTVAFANADLSYSQTHGVFSGSSSGSLKNWSVVSSGINNLHNHVTGTLSNTVAVAASASKLKTGTGGNVFYLGSHDYTTANVQNLNGIRMYMNALLTPALRPCLFMLLNSDIRNFTGQVRNNVTRLDWSVSENQNADYFEVEKSNDGKLFTTIANVGRQTTQGVATYNYTEAYKIQERSYYRIILYSKTSGKKTSKTIVLEQEGNSFSTKLTIEENPVSSIISFTYSAAVSEPTSLNIYNSSGRKVYSTIIQPDKGTNSFTIPADQCAFKGMYFLEVINSRERSVAKFLKI